MKTWLGHHSWKEAEAIVTENAFAGGWLLLLSCTGVGCCCSCCLVSLGIIVGTQLPSDIAIPRVQLYFWKQNLLKIGRWDVLNVENVERGGLEDSSLLNK